MFSGPPLGRRNGCRPRAPAAPARGVGMGAKAGCVLAGLTLEVGTGAVQSRVADGGGDCVTGNRSELPASRSSACGTQSGPAVHHLGQLLPCLAQSWVCRAPVLGFGTTVLTPRQTHASWSPPGEVFSTCRTRTRPWGRLRRGWRNKLFLSWIGNMFVQKMWELISYEEESLSISS